MTDMIYTKNDRALDYWYDLTPMGRYEIMQAVDSKKKSMRGKMNDYVSYIKENIV